MDHDTDEILVDPRAGLAAPTSPAQPIDAPLVGRDRALADLERIIESAAEDRQLVFATVVGEPGMGKTRLLDALVERLELKTTAAHVLRGGVSERRRPYAPIVALLKQRFCIEPNDRPETARRKIEEAIAASTTGSLATNITHLLAHLLGVPYLDSPVVESLANVPGQLELRTFVAVRRFLAQQATDRQLVIVVDNIERADPQTINLLRYLADGLRDSAVVLLAAARPTLYRTAPQWSTGGFKEHRVDLAPLSPDECETLLDNALRSVSLGARHASPADPHEASRTVSDLPAAVRRVARESLDGNPRGVLDFAKYLLEAGAISEHDGHLACDAKRLGHGLPRGHEEIVKLRLRLLPAAEARVLQKAAIIGETFWLGGVSALIRCSDASSSWPDGPPLEAIPESDDAATEIQEAIAHLCDRGLIEEAAHSTVPGDRQFNFCYPPLWNLAHELAEESSRQTDHALAAQWLELLPDGRSELVQEIIGEHLELAGDNHGAAMHFRRAADHARAEYFNHRAIALYERALARIEDSDLSTRLHIWHDLSNVYELTGEFDLAFAACERIVRLSWLIASQVKTAVAFNKMGRLWRKRGSLQQALDYFRRALELFRLCADDRGIAMSHDDIGQVYRLLGRYDEALDSSARALEIRRELGDLRSIASSLSNIGNIESDRGLHDEARACHEEALQIRERIRDRFGCIVSRNSLAALSFESGDYDQATTLWEAARREAERIGAIPLLVVVLNNLGELSSKLGLNAEARSRLLRAMELARDLEDPRSQADIARNLALIDMAQGRLSEARAQAERSLKLAEKAEIPELVGRAYVLLGTIGATSIYDSSGLSADEDPQRYFEAATAVFSRIGNDLELARTLHRHGQYCIERGENDAARPRLEQAANLFAKLGLPGSEEVNALLASLSQ